RAVALCLRLGGVGPAVFRSALLSLSANLAVCGVAGGLDLVRVLATRERVGSPGSRVESLVAVLLDLVGVLGSELLALGDLVLPDQFLGLVLDVVEDAHG